MESPSLPDAAKVALLREAVKAHRKYTDEVGQKYTDEVGQRYTDEVGQKYTDEVGQKYTDEVGQKYTDEVGQKYTDEIFYILYTFLFQWEFLMGNLGRFPQGRASCNRVVLPNPN